MQEIKSEKTMLEEKNKFLENDNVVLDSTIKKINLENTNLLEENKELKQRIEELERNRPVSRGSAHGTDLGVFDTVCYDLPGYTASGLPVGPGVIAVDPDVIPLGSKVYLEYDDEWSFLNGIYVAADVGTAIIGNIIDLWYDGDQSAYGRRTVRVTLIE